MNRINDGGPAFPVCSVCGAQATIRQGNQKLCDKHYRFWQMRPTPSLAELDLRDYFAAKAMAALIAEPVNEGQTISAWHWTSQLRTHTQMSGPDIIAHAAYMMADAMLRARENTKGCRDAAPAVHGEPVAYISQEDFEFLLSDDMSNQYGTRQVPVFSRKGCRASVPLYASPQPPAQIAEGRSDE